MGHIKAKTINLLLYSGELDGVISIEDSSWNGGELFAAPRESVSELLQTEAIEKSGVYLLLSKDKVYVGQSRDLAKRITRHTVGKDWWNNVIILTSKGTQLSHADIDYLESKLITMALETDGVSCENIRKGEKQLVDKFREVFLQQYLDEALFLMRLIGMDVFSNKRDKTIKKNTDKEFKNGSSLKINASLQEGKGRKNEAIEFVKAGGIQLEKNISYAILQEQKNEFWINPQTTSIEKDWNLILNNNRKNTLHVLFVPKNELQINRDIFVRKDNSKRIDLNINANTFIDRKSSFDFSKYIVNEIKY